MSEPRRAVIIAGGGVGGLTLASALEKAGVDYVLLERGDIAPELGASITSLPCTTVVHEQLGFGQAVVDATVPLVVREHYDENGRRFARSNETALLLERAGRAMIFPRRQFVLQQLYDSISDKTNVRARTGISSYTEDEHGVTVVTDTNEAIRGDVLVGADGIHSSVRRLMASKLEKASPEAAKNLIEGFTTRYRCIFGTSHNHFQGDPGRVFVPDGTTQNVYYRGVGGLASAGVPGLLFWFLYLPVEEVTHTPHSPVYSEADCVEAISKYGHLKLGPGYTFQDLYDSRVKATMVPMEEGVISAKWNSGRVVLLGDAVHKATANLGLGGNCAIDGVCYLVNEILPLLKTSGPAGPSARDLAAAFDRYEAKQRPRVEICVKMSGYAVRLETMETWWLRLLLYIIPWIPTKLKSDFFYDFDHSAPHLDFLPVQDPKKQDRYID